MRKAGGILVVQLRMKPYRSRMTRTRGTTTHKAAILPLRSDDAYVVGSEATLNTRVFNNVQVSPWTKGRIPLFHLDETTRRAEESTPFLRQRIMAEACSSTSEATATLSVQAPFFLELAEMSTSPASQTPTLFT